MSAIAGVYHLDGRPATGEEVAAMTAALAHRGPDSSGAWCGGPVALGHRLLHTTPESLRERQPVRDDARGLVLIADARIDNRAELRAALAIERARPISDADLILSAYQRWGAECADRLLGDFAFALWDSRARTLFCARDPMGVKPFYYFRSDRLFAFASEVKALFTIQDVPRRLDHERVASFVDWVEVDRTSTFYEGIHRLPAAHSLTVCPERETRTRYWSPEARRDVRYATGEQYAEAFREIFGEAVRARLRSAFPVSATLSGGLDSSSVVCMARHVRRGEGGSEADPLCTLSLVFPDASPDDLRLIDERRYVEAVVRGGGLDSKLVRGDRLSPLMDVERILWHLDEPYAAPNLYLHWGLYGTARSSGARVILDGFDGDSVVSHGFGRLNGLAQAGAWSSFEDEVRAFASRRGIAPGRVVEQFGLPYLARLARSGHWLAWRRAAAEITHRFRLSRGQVALRYGLLPLIPSRLREVWESTKGRSASGRSLLRAELSRRRSPPDVGLLEHEAHVRGLSQPAYQLTLETADKCAGAFGLEPRYPFFDRRLIEFCLGVPEEHRFSDGWPRLVFRRAMEGILPPEVQWRSDKGNLSSNFHRRLREVDHPRVESACRESVDLGRFVDRRALRDIERDYFANPRTKGRDERGHQLFRAAVLAIWLLESKGGREERARAPAATSVAA